VRFTIACARPSPWSAMIAAHDSRELRTRSWDRPELLEGAPERAALARRRLEQDRALPLVRRERPVEGVGHRVEPALLVGAGAGVDDQVGRADLVAASQLVDEGRDGFFTQLARGAAEG